MGLAPFLRVAPKHQNSALGSNLQWLGFTPKTGAGDAARMIAIKIVSWKDAEYERAPEVPRGLGGSDDVA
jgi:hypothetical protein